MNMAQIMEVKPHPTQADAYYVNAAQVACDGGELGHPRVFLEVDDNGEVVCPYCSRKFIYQK